MKQHNWLSKRGRKQQLETLTLLAKHGPVPMSRLATTLGISSFAAGKRAHRYKKYGWVVSVANTALGTTFRVTRAGLRRVEWIREGVRRFQRSETKTPSN